MVYKNSFFQLVTNDKGTFIKLFPPMEGGKLLDAREIADYLDGENVFGYDINQINKAVLELDKEPMLVPVSDEKILPADEKMMFQVSSDRMNVYARFYPPSKGGSVLDLDSIVRLLNQRQITYGIQQKAILTFLHKRQYCCNYLIAAGTPARNGNDARIEYHFDIDRKARPTMLEDGSVDFHHLDAINHVEKGALLATLHREDVGDRGKDVLGNDILPYKVKPLKLKYGKNISESEDQTEIYSNIDGHVHLEVDKVFVSDTYEILGDVDASTGDIDYEGNVDVKGNVRTGFTIRATGDVNVKGVVEGASIYAGGRVVIQRGIQGMSKGYVESRGNVYAKFIENSTVKTSGGVVTEAIMHSEVMAQGDVIVDGKKGLITGGRVCSRSMIALKTGGSDMGTVTRLEVGADPEIVEQCHMLAKSLPDLQRTIDNNQRIVDMYSKKLGQGDKLKPEQIVALKDAKQQVEKANATFHENQGKMERLQEEIMANSNGVIKAASVLYPGVEVLIADVQMHIRTETKYCRLIRDGADIRVQAY